jgi:hypothetical protein
VQPLRPLSTVSPLGAVWRGAVTALVVALPAGVVNQFVADGAGSPVTLLLWVVIMFGAAAGGYAVVRLCPDAGLPHAAAAGAAAYVVVQGVGVLRRLTTGEQISWIAYPFLMLLMATVAMLGGVYARRIVARYGGGDAEPSGEDR